jgi:hypothetical protein
LMGAGGWELLVMIFVRVWEDEVNHTCQMNSSFFLLITQPLSSYFQEIIKLSA